MNWIKRMVCFMFVILCAVQLNVLQAEAEAASYDKNDIIKLELDKTYVKELDDVEIGGSYGSGITDHYVFQPQKKGFIKIKFNFNYDGEMPDKYKKETVRRIHVRLCEDADERVVFFIRHTDFTDL